MNEARHSWSDAVTGLILLLFTTALGTQIKRIQTVESRFMPLFALGFISICALWLIIRNVALKRSDSRQLSYHIRELIVWGMTVAFWVLISVLGFYTSALLFLFVCQMFLWGRPTSRSILRSLTYSMTTTTVMYLCFTMLLKMSLPKGALI